MALHHLSINLLTSTRFITALSAFHSISMAVALMSSKGLVVSVPQAFAQRDWYIGSLTEYPLSQKNGLISPLLMQGQSWSPQWAHWKQAWLTVMSGVWVKLGQTGRSQTHACTQQGSARTAHLLSFVSGRIPHASFLLVFVLQERCELPGSWLHCSHFWNAPVTAFHSKGWKASQISFCFLCSWYTLSTYPTPCWSRGFLWLTGWSQCEGRRSGRQGEIAQKSWYLTFSSKERYLLVTCSQLVLVA